MYHFLYETTNKKNGRRYIGVHSSKVNPLEHFDDYLGSGHYFVNAVRKYGKDCFQRKLLVICDSAKYAFMLEERIVNDTFITDKNTYNIVVGGKGGYINKKTYKSKKFRRSASKGGVNRSEALRSKLGEEGYREYMQNLSLKNTEESRKKAAEKYKAKYKDESFMALKKESAKRSWQSSSSEERRKIVSNWAKRNWEKKSKSERIKFGKNVSRTKTGTVPAFNLNTGETKVVSCEKFHSCDYLVAHNSIKARERKEELKMNSASTEKGCITLCGSII